MAGNFSYRSIHNNTVKYRHWPAYKPITLLEQFTPYILCWMFFLFALESFVTYVCVFKKICSASIGYIDLVPNLGTIYITYLRYKILRHVQYFPKLFNFSNGYCVWGHFFKETWIVKICLISRMTHCLSHNCKVL